MDWFVRACFTEEGFELQPAEAWTDDQWFLDQDQRTLVPNDGWWSIAEGMGRGRLVGGNLCTLNMLQGTPYWPSLDGAVLAVEDDELTDRAIFARDLTSLLQQPDAAGIRGLMVGRFQRVSGVNRDLLEQILARQPQLSRTDRRRVKPGPHRRTLSMLWSRRINPPAGRPGRPHRCRRTHRPSTPSWPAHPPG
jgi:muramoyltetrapeptide carboxypeptidase